MRGINESAKCRLQNKLCPSPLIPFLDTFLLKSLLHPKRQKAQSPRSGTQRFSGPEGVCVCNANGVNRCAKGTRGVTFLAFAR
jgi:hypothetical protein